MEKVGEIFKFMGEEVWAREYKLEITDRYISIQWPYNDARVDMPWRVAKDIFTFINQKEKQDGV